MERPAVQPASDIPTNREPLLSVALITHNEAANLARTLSSVQWADEILIVDSGSMDDTVAIAQSFGATVLHHAWQGFAAQKNYALSQCHGTWILSLDADEELTPELQQELRTLLATNPAADAFRLKRRNLFLGRWIRRGGFYPDSKLRLVRRSAKLTFTARPVHETISAPEGKASPTPTLQHDLLHHAYPNLTAYLEHMNRYSTLGAQLLLTKGRTSPTLPAFLLNTVLAPAANFVWNYLFRLGFLDGREGLLLHLYQAAYTSQKYAKAWEAARVEKRPPPNL